MLHRITCTYGLYPIRTPHAQHLKFGGHRVRDQAIKKCIVYSYAAKSKVAIHWIEEVYADIMQLYQQPSYTVQVAEDLAKFLSEITTNTSDGCQRQYNVFGTVDQSRSADLLANVQKMNLGSGSD